MVALKRILVGSPVCQKPEILNAFLNSLKNLSHEGFLIDYIFVDDNKDPVSRRILSEFQREGSEVYMIPASERSSYLCNEDTHHWNDNLMLRVGEYKNRIIRFALEKQYAALFFIDSDLIIHPGLIEHLQKAGKDVIAELFWTSWHPGQPLEPNVWLFDEYDMVFRSPGEEVSEVVAARRKKQFLNMLKVPGVYEVGGLGACTLISRDALLRGVDFSYIPNLTIHGEDRFFCIRAAVLGIGLYVDTSYPAYHIYRMSDLDGAPNYIKEKSKKTDSSYAGGEKKQRITLSMTVRNEEGRYLDKVLGSLRDYIDEAVIIDDASEDDTAGVCEELLKDIPHRIIRNRDRMFTNEVELRKKQWEETIKTNPDWILNLDGDEVMEYSFFAQIEALMNDPQYDLYGFRLYDMWNDSEYREDPYWNAHESSRIFLLRYQPDFSYKWKETAQHCGRFPSNLEEFPRCDTEFRVQHLGWARPEDRKDKYDRYKQMDPDAVYGVKEQYDSILDPHPHLLSWKEGECNQK